MNETAQQINEILKARLPGLAPGPGKFPTAIEGLYTARRDADVRIDCFNEPVIAVIVQGNKRLAMAGEDYRCGEGWYIACGMNLPGISHITGASPEHPHIALGIPLDRYLLTELTAGLAGPGGRQALSGPGAYKGVTVAEAPAELLGAFLRLVNLLDAPARIPVLAPMIIREIHLLLLTGAEGEDFRLLGTAESPNNQIAQAVSWLREHYKEPFSLAELAGRFNMSQTSFCRHFSRITGMAPLQFHKRLRLYEAQRLMLTEETGAEASAYAVGYESPSQFTREYKRQFGEPPRRDIQRLITAKAVTVS